MMSPSPSSNSRLRAPTLGLACLSVCLTLAVIGTGGRSLYVYYHQRSDDPWLLPLWPNHFDSRELQLLIGTSGAIFVLNVILAISIFIPALPVNGIVAASSFSTTIIASLTLAFSTVMNNQAPHHDTLQTWTCRWSATEIFDGQSPPYQFQGLCTKTKFAYYTTIPILILQVLLLAVGTYTTFSRSSQHRSGHQEIEKQMGLQLQDVHGNANANGSTDAVGNVSYQAKNESRKIYQDSNGFYGFAK